MSKAFWILAGGNGSGKSRFFDVYLRRKGIRFVNADEIVKSHYPGGGVKNSRKAQKHAWDLCIELFEKGETFCFETVFSHESKIDLIINAKSHNYEVNLIYIHLDNPELNQARVIQRVNEGGHDVPPEKIISRIPKTQKNIRYALTLVDQARVLDNSSGEDPFKQVAIIKKKKIIYLIPSLPDWALEILQDFNA